MGVVGPRHHHGNEVDMTYDFTHKTHLDLFGFHYPRLFTDWWADVWITRVYQYVSITTICFLCSIINLVVPHCTGSSHMLGRSRLNLLNTTIRAT